VTLASATEGAEIWYTINGGILSNAAPSLKHETPIIINEPVTLRAMAFKEGYNPSEMMIVAYTYIHVPVTGVTLRSAISIVAGESETLTATVLPVNASNRAVTWSSDNTAIAAVDENGKVTVSADAPANATVRITARTVDGGFEASCTVTVTDTASQFQVGGIYYKLISGSDVEVTNKSYNDGASAAQAGDSYSGAVTVPASVTYDGITYTVTRVGARAFFGNTALTSVALPDGLQAIYSQAFHGCSALTTLNIPASVTGILAQAFFGCSKLALNAAADGIFSVIGGVLYQSEGSNSLYSLRWIPETRTGEYIIPNGVVHIARYAIRNNKLAKINIPVSVINFEGFNFGGCNSLTEITLNWENPAMVTMGTLNTYFEDFVSFFAIKLRVPAGTTDAYKQHMLWGRGFEILTQ